MYTLLSLISFFTVFFWLRIWDKAIKKKVGIIELLPSKDENVKWGLIVIPTGITCIFVIYLILTYFP
jgi:hypothetical protein